MIAPEPAVDWSDWFAGRVSRMHASEIRELLKLLERPDVVSFAGGIPDPALFPMDAIRTAYAEILADPQLGTQSLQYSVSEGYGPLRRAVRDRQHRHHVGLAARSRLHR
jgi:DNA-binding transcriptional MocR family regulator